MHFMRKQFWNTRNILRICFFCFVLFCFFHFSRSKSYFLKYNRNIKQESFISESIRNVFNLRARKFHLQEYKKFFRADLFLFSQGCAQKFLFPKYKNSIFLKYKKSFFRENVIIFFRVEFFNFYQVGLKSVLGSYF